MNFEPLALFLQAVTPSTSKVGVNQLLVHSANQLSEKTVEQVSLRAELSEKFLFSFWNDIPAQQNKNISHNSFPIRNGLEQVFKSN